MASAGWCRWWVKRVVPDSGVQMTLPHDVTFSWAIRYAGGCGSLELVTFLPRSQAVRSSGFRTTSRRGFCHVTGIYSQSGAKLKWAPFTLQFTVLVLAPGPPLGVVPDYRQEAQ